RLALLDPPGGRTNTRPAVSSIISGEPFDRFLEDGDAGLDVLGRLLRVGLVLDADVALELDVPQGLEHARHVEHAAVLAVDDISLALVVVVLEMDAEVARPHGADLGGRVELLAELLGPDQVAGVEAGADERVMVLDRGHDDLGGVPAVQLTAAGGAVRVDGDGDLVLVHELVEAVEAVRRGVGADVLDVELLGEGEDALVGVVVLVKTLNAPGDGRDAVVLAHGPQGLDLGGAAVERGVLLEELDVVQAEILNALEGRLGVELPEGVTLHA